MKHTDKLMNWFLTNPTKIMQPDLRLEQCVKVLTLCAEKFESYADHHNAKGGMDKTIANRGMAVLCLETIGKVRSDK